MSELELTRTFWASANSPVFLNGDGGVTIEHPSGANSWRIFINLTISEIDDEEDGGEDRRNSIESFELDTAARGWAAFDEFDTALNEHGYLRSSPWEIGSGHGFVAWIEIDERAVSD